MKTTKALRFNFRLSLCLLTLCGLGTLCAAAATVRGSSDASVVWISVPTTAQISEVSMRNHDRTFDPPFVVVPVGGTVRFPNDDPFYHSIYSDSEADAFDIGYYGQGPGKTATFSKPGIVEVHCHIHAYMRAWIVVADGPFVETSKGTYELNAIPGGKHALHAWDPAHGERTTIVDVPDGNAVITVNIGA